jgi:hypothetical protein
MGGGNPATWPAAKAQPPSLAGAYSPNMEIAFKALITYSDWAGSHPNPVLVRNFCLSGSDMYSYWVEIMQDLVRRGWRDYPDPTEVDFLHVVQQPVALTSQGGQPLRWSGHQAYLGGVLDVVINEKKDPYLNKTGRVVGYSGGGGPTAVTVSLAQGTADGQFRIATWHVLSPAAGVAAWERHLEARP